MKKNVLAIVLVAVFGLVAASVVEASIVGGGAGGGVNWDGSWFSVYTGSGGKGSYFSVNLSSSLNRIDDVTIYLSPNPTDREPLGFNANVRMSGVLGGNLNQDSQNWSLSLPGFNLADGLFYSSNDDGDKTFVQNGAWANGSFSGASIDSSWSSYNKWYRDWDNLIGFSWVADFGGHFDSLSSAQAVFGNGVYEVPEPATVGLLVTGGLAFLRRRRNRIA